MIDLNGLCGRIQFFHILSSPCKRGEKVRVGWICLVIYQSSDLCPLWLVPANDRLSTYDACNWWNLWTVCVLGKEIKPRRSLLQMVSKHKGSYIYYK